MSTAKLVEYRPPRIAMSFVLVAIAAHFALSAPIHAGAPIAGAILGLAGFGLMIRAWWLFQHADTAICPTETATMLITGDVYGLSRHPMYLGMAMMLAGIALWFGTLPFYVATAAFVVVMDRVFCPFEEEKSGREFGEQYAEYSRRVRRWL